MKIFSGQREKTRAFGENRVLDSQVILFYVLPGRSNFIY